MNDITIFFLLGKTFMCREIIKASATLIHPPPQRILYCYSEWQSLYDDMPEIVEFHQGINEDLLSRDNLKNQQILLIIDDLNEDANGTLISAIFTRMSHHRFISVIYLTNSLFSNQRNYRLLASNTQYYGLFRSTRDHASIAILARQMVGSKAYKKVEQAYIECTKEPYGYLFCDLKANTPKELRFRTKILPHEDTICFVIKND